MVVKEKNDVGWPQVCRWIRRFVFWRRTTKATILSSGARSNQHREGPALVPVNGGLGRYFCQSAVIYLRPVFLNLPLKQVSQSNFERYSAEGCIFYASRKLLLQQKSQRNSIFPQPHARPWPDRRKSTERSSNSANPYILVHVRERPR